MRDRTGRLSRWQKGKGRFLYKTLALVGLLGVFWVKGAVEGPSVRGSVSKPPSAESQLPEAHATQRHLLEEEALYPPDAFEEDERKDGAIVLHCIGVIYMFLALSVSNLLARRRCPRARLRVRECESTRASADPPPAHFCPLRASMTDRVR